MTTNSRIFIPGLQERLFDVDPLTGVKTYFALGPKGEWQFRHEFPDVKNEIDLNNQQRKDPDNWKKGVKDNMVHYAHIPDAVLFQWHCNGVDIRDNKELFKMVNKPEWGYLKCVDKIHVAKG